MVIDDEKFFTAKCFIFIDVFIRHDALFYGYLYIALFVRGFDSFNKIIDYTGIFVLFLVYISS